MKKLIKIKEIWIHIIVWICFLSFPIGISFGELGKVDPNFLPRFILQPLVLVYVNYLFLVPKFLLKKKLLAYIIISVLFILFFNVIINSYFFPAPFKKFLELTDTIVLTEQEKMLPFRQLPYAMSFIFSLAFFLLGGVLGLVKEFYKKDKVNQEIKVQSKETELQFLRAQLNPHFLFNSLNSIYSLVRNKSREAPEAVITLSELMRYMLYEAREEMVPLSKEISYIKNFIHLQRFRLKDSSALKLKIIGEYQDKKIPPLLLIPFVENAFKYGTDFNGKTDINIKMEIYNENFFFEIKNKIGLHRKDKINSGIGLNNIENRLRLIYPDNHALKINKNGGTYSVQLELNLSK
ncbi:sensor histidine kinase [Croceitalea rosinachiae]|uniref:Histidine kinase n=1 Tax=Croceitalea rosinachiae TaxID=3075596 RepID=A0ABU3A9C6_9FLAO|nr:histidine kinase [Croceitalea sp. F388]MDT0606807.1 histidine kinase [Croceitalea sp. F388]